MREKKFAHAKTKVQMRCAKKSTVDQHLYFCYTDGTIYPEFQASSNFL